MRHPLDIAQKLENRINFSCLLLIGITSSKSLICLNAPGYDLGQDSRISVASELSPLVKACRHFTFDTSRAQVSVFLSFLNINNKFFGQSKLQLLPFSCSVGWFSGREQSKYFRHPCATRLGGLLPPCRMDFFHLAGYDGLLLQDFDGHCRSRERLTQVRDAL